MKSTIQLITKRTETLIENIESLRKLLSQVEETCPGLFAKHPNEQSVSEIIKTSIALSKMFDTILNCKD